MGALLTTARRSFPAIAKQAVASNGAGTAETKKGVVDAYHDTSTSKAICGSCFCLF